MVFHPLIDPNGTIDYIAAQLMANFISNGMSIRAVARQLGITHSTVYARLYKYDLIKKDDEDKVILQPTASDLAEAGAIVRIKHSMKKLDSAAQFEIAVMNKRWKRKEP